LVACRRGEEDPVDLGKADTCASQKAAGKKVWTSKGGKGEERPGFPAERALSTRVRSKRREGSNRGSPRIKEKKGLSAGTPNHGSRGGRKVTLSHLPS